MALVEAPPELDGLGVTVMDGPFFSMMPFPSRDSTRFRTCAIRRIFIGTTSAASILMRALRPTIAKRASTA